MRTTRSFGGRPFLCALFVFAFVSLAYFGAVVFVFMFVFHRLGVAILSFIPLSLIPLSVRIRIFFPYVYLATLRLTTSIHQLFPFFF